MSKELLAGLDKQIEKGLKAMNVPGVAVAVVKDGEVIYAEGFGYADVENKVKMTADHILPIGSASKAFTATAAVMLAGEGKLDLDQPIRNYLPEFQLYDQVAGANATTRDLLCHRTGMPRHDLGWINWNDMNRSEIVTKWLRNLPPSKPFRSVWQYQNYMFATVGYLVERLTGQTWEEFVAQRIFEPIKLKSGSFRMKYPDKTGKHAKLYLENRKGKIEECAPLIIDAMGPAGSINATVRDMANWVLFNLNQGKVGDKELVEPKAFAELHKPNIPYELSPIVVEEKKKLGYGLGWFIDCYRGKKWVEHGGNVIGASALVQFMPEDNIGCVVLTNANGTSLPGVIAYEVMDRLLGHAGEKDWLDFNIEAMKPFKEQAEKQRKEFEESFLKDKPMLHEKDEYVGTYTHPGYGEIVISADKKSGDMKLRFHNNEGALNHMHYDIFYFEMMQMPLVVSFRTGAKGSVDALTIPLEPTLEPAVFKKAEEKKEAAQ